MENGDIGFVALPFGKPGKQKMKDCRALFVAGPHDNGLIDVLVQLPTGREHITIFAADFRPMKHLRWKHRHGLKTLEAGADEMTTTASKEGPRRPFVSARRAGA